MARYKNADITVQATMEYECDLDKKETRWDDVLNDDLETKIVITWDDLEQIFVRTFEDAKAEVDALIGTGVHPE